MLNIKNRTIFCKDNLDVLQGINSESIDLIYLDPPFNKKKTFTAPIGSGAEGASFKDYFREEDVKDEWVETIKEDHIELYNFLNGVKSIHNNNHYCYLCYMAIRLIEMRRVLKDTGSIYFHCDPTMSHYVKIMMDTIFGEDNFRNEIVWCYHGPGSPKMRQFNRKSDNILWYSKGETWTFNADNVRVKYKDEKQSLRRAMSTDGEFSQEEVEEYRKRGKVPENWWEMRIAARSKKEYVGYPTQKPLALLDRIIKASSNEGDVVLDAFCGCATTCVAAERLNRKWVGIDISIKAYDLVKDRLKKEVVDRLDFGGKGGEEIKRNFSTDSPKRTDKNGDDRLKKYIYIISHPKFEGYYKVGIAKDYKTRLNSYQTSDPDRAYKMEYFYLTPHFRETEKYIHNLFDNKFEWIKARLEDIKKEIKNYKHKE